MGDTPGEAKVDAYIGPTKRGVVIIIVFGIIHRKLGESHKLCGRALFYKEGLKEGRMEEEENEGEEGKGREPGGKGGGKGGGKREEIN